MNDQTKSVSRLEDRIDSAFIGPAKFLRNVVAIENVSQAMEVAKMMAVSKQGVPKHLRNEPGMCLAVVMQAKEWEMAPYAVARKSYVVNDILAYESQLIHAVIEARAPLRTRLNCRYEGEGPKRRCIVFGTFRGDNDQREYTSPEFGNIPVKNSPLWKSDPDQQMFYYSSRAWCRKWCPDVLLGVYTADEIVDVTPIQQVVNPLGDDEPGASAEPKMVPVELGSAGATPAAGATWEIDVTGTVLDPIANPAPQKPADAPEPQAATTPPKAKENAPETSARTPRGK